MTENTGMQRLQLWVLVACLVAAPLLLAAAMMVHPGEGDRGLVGTLAQYPGRVEAASLLIIFSSLLFAPALLGLLRFLPGRGTVLAHIGVGLALIGVIGHAVWAGFQIVLLALVQSGMDRAQLTTLVEGDPPNAAFVVVLLMFLVGFFLGLMLLAGGLWRSAIFPKWAAVGIGVLPLFDFLPIDNQALFMVGPALGIISFGGIALTVLRETMGSVTSAENTARASGVSVGAQPRTQ